MEHVAKVELQTEIERLEALVRKLEPASHEREELIDIVCNLRDLLEK